MIYLDSSALVKLAIAEPESPGLLSWLTAQPNLVRVASSVIRVEVPRAVWRAEPSALPESYLVLRRTTEIELTDEVLSKAASVRPVTLGAIDAIHLASALVAAAGAHLIRLLRQAPARGGEGGRPADRQPCLTWA